MTSVTDKFGCKIQEGDWILYVAMRDDGVPALRWGQIDRFINLSFGREGNDWVIKIRDCDEADSMTQPHLAIKFTQEERTMRKLLSDL